MDSEPRASCHNVFQVFWIPESGPGQAFSADWRSHSLCLESIHFRVSKLRDRLTEIYDILYSTHGPQRWWPGETRFEIILGAILTQNTAWHNVSLAIANLRAEGLLEPNALIQAEAAHVKALIAPSGFFNVKYDRLRSFLEYLTTYDTGLERLLHSPTLDLRNEFLEINGIGPETADSILLYAFDRPIFVVDAYTRRLLSRLGYAWMAKAPYEEIQTFLMEGLRAEATLYNEFHALIVAHCKTTCKKNPLCTACDLSPLCAAAQS